MNVETGKQKLVASQLLAEDGFEILDEVLTPQECQDLGEELSKLHEQHRASAGSKLGGLRNLIRLVPQVTELASSIRLKSLIASRLQKNVFPVRALFFDKTPDANWSVAWHQDLSIAVVEKIETPGFGGWSIKEGVPHVQRAGVILEGMVTMRLHLDDCNADNGPLRVVPRSHHLGKLNAAEISQRSQSDDIAVCEVARGGALLMHPLLLHSSSPSKNPSHRRVLHLEYASDELPNGLKWFDC